MIELVLVVLIIGILAAVSAPRYFRLVERNRTEEAIQAFRAIKGAQDRYFSKHGAYLIGPVGGLDIVVPNLQYFNAWPNMTAGTGVPSWRIRATRNRAASIYGAYVLTFDARAAGAPSLTCSNAACQNDLLAALIP